MEQENNKLTAQMCNKFREEISKVLVGQAEVIDQLLCAFFSGGHVLLEGVPGTAKTLLAKTFSLINGAEFQRIQFTPDLMPSDVIGTHVFDLKSSQFHLKKGPVFTNFLLADEINRTPPKTQSALLEAMEENQVTIEGEKMSLPEIFMVIATQNPVEFEGTYPLPEAQLDRFFYKISIDYPKKEEEHKVLLNYHQGFNPKKLDEISFEKIDFREFMKPCLEEINCVSVSEGIFNYIIDITGATRNNPQVGLGASPRGAVALLLSSKTRSAMAGRDYVLPDDVKQSAFPVLRHRIFLRPEAEIEGVTADNVIKTILSKIPVPR